MENIIVHPNKTVINSQLEQQFEQIEAQIKLNAQNNGSKNQPSPQNRKLHSFFKEHHLAYQGLVDGVGRDLLFKSSVDEVVEHKAATDAQLRAINISQLELKEKHIALISELKSKKSPYSNLRLWGVWIAITCLTSFDGLLSYGTWVAFGFSYVTSILATILFAGALTVLAHVFDKIVLIGKTKLQQRMIVAALITMLTAVFTFMALYRAAYLENELAQNGLQNTHISSLPFILLSLLLFVAAVAIKLFAYPTKAQCEQKQEYQRCQKALKDNEAGQQTLNEQQAALQRKHAKIRQANTNKLEYGSMLETLIISRAHKGFEEWKKHNMNARPDNCRPLSFDEQYPFEFQTNFHTIKKL